MKARLIIYLIFLSFCSFGQTYDNLVIGKKPITQTVQICDNQNESIRHGNFKNITGEDSLYNCRYAMIFETDSTGIYYQKEYNLLDTLVAEGPVTRTLNKKKFFKKRTFSYFKNGIWKEYDYINREINYISCSQGNCDRGGWNIQIWEKTEKMK